MILYLFANLLAVQAQGGWQNVDVEDVDTDVLELLQKHIY